MKLSDMFSEQELIKQINRSGSGQCIYLPIRVLRVYGLKLKDSVKLELVKDGILIKPIKKVD